MKYEQFSLSVILTVLGRSTSVVYASETGEALAACKKYISELYEGKLRTKVTSIRDRRSGSEIKIRVPPWMQSSGLEWLFRLACEPRRLWRRYLLGNPRFLIHFAVQRMRELVSRPARLRD